MPTDNTSSLLASMDPKLAHTLIWCTVIVIAKVLVTNLISFIPNTLSNQGPAEDRWLWNSLLGDRRGDTCKRAEAWSRRMNRVVGNDLENVPVSLMALWLAAATTTGTGSSSAADAEELIWLARLFAASRVAHSVTYMLGITGVRTAAYFAGLYAVVRALQLAVQAI